MAVTLRYFTEFGKPAFQHITDSARIELIDHLYSKHEEHRPVAEFMRLLYFVVHARCRCEKVHVRNLIF